MRVFLYNDLKDVFKAICVSDEEMNHFYDLAIRHFDGDPFAWGKMPSKLKIALIDWEKQQFTSEER